MRKLICLMLALLLLNLVLTGCGDTAKATIDEGKTNAASEEKTELTPKETPEPTPEPTPRPSPVPEQILLDQDGVRIRFLNRAYTSALEGGFWGLYLMVENYGYDSITPVCMELWVNGENIASDRFSSDLQAIEPGEVAIGAIYPAIGDSLEIETDFGVATLPGMADASDSARLGALEVGDTFEVRMATDNSFIGTAGELVTVTIHSEDTNTGIVADEEYELYNCDGLRITEQVDSRAMLLEEGIPITIENNGEQSVEVFLYVGSVNGASALAPEAASFSVDVIAGQTEYKLLNCRELAGKTDLADGALTVELRGFVTPLSGEGEEAHIVLSFPLF